MAESIGRGAGGKSVDLRKRACLACGRVNCVQAGPIRRDRGREKSVTFEVLLELPSTVQHFVLHLSSYLKLLFAQH